MAPYMGYRDYQISFVAIKENSWRLVRDTPRPADEKGVPRIGRNTEKNAVRPCEFGDNISDRAVKIQQGRLSKLQELMIKKINEAGGMAFKVTSLQEVKNILKGVMPE